MDHHDEVDKYGQLEIDEMESENISRAEQRPFPVPYRRFFIYCMTLFLIIQTWLLVQRGIYNHYGTEGEVVANKSAKVPLEAHIMSKCPDAKDCLKDLVVPAMEKIHDKVDFKLSYIGTYVRLRSRGPWHPIPHLR